MCERESAIHYACLRIRWDIFESHNSELNPHAFCLLECVLCAFGWLEAIMEREKKECTVRWHIVRHPEMFRQIERQTHNVNGKLTQLSWFHLILLLHLQHLPPWGHFSRHCCQTTTQIERCSLEFCSHNDITIRSGVISKQKNIWFNSTYVDFLAHPFDFRIGIQTVKVLQFAVAIR